APDRGSPGRNIDADAAGAADTTASTDKGADARADCDPNRPDSGLTKDTMQRIIYIHIPKTGGSTMRQVMTQNVGRQHLFAVGKRHAKQVPWFFNLPQAERDSFQNVLGHIRYGVHRWFSTGTASYF